MTGNYMFWNTQHVSVRAPEERKMKETKSCLICGKEATYVCRWKDCTPRYMCSEHKYLLEEQGEYVCEEVEG